MNQSFVVENYQKGRGKLVPRNDKQLEIAC